MGLKADQSGINRRNANLFTSLFKNGLIANLFKNGLIANLFKKGLIENGIVGVIKRRNGCV
ncbi:hypothetical protein [Methanosarcina sp.]|uniref:hypothetical protein n=1 Tax=Methanosarcina sp. TaxID=2213 RepID=UPI003C794118